MREGHRLITIVAWQVHEKWHAVRIFTKW